MNYTITNVDETRAGISVEISAEENDDKKGVLFKPSFWFEENLSVGDIIDGDRLDRLMDTANLCCAIARAESLLASSDYSRHRLINRLLHYNIEKEVCEKTADYMIEKGFINEEEQTVRITNFYCQRKHWGKKRIAAELMGRGYNRKAIFAALNTVSDTEYYNSLLKLVAEKYPEAAGSKKERELRIAAVSRMGYSLDEILRAFKETEETLRDIEEEAFDD